MARSWWRYVAVGVVVLLLVGCGGSPTSSDPPASIAGSWIGIMQYTQTPSAGNTVNIAMDLTQAGSTVSGTWRIAIANGTVSGTTTPSSFSGTFTFNSFTMTGDPCTGTFAVSGQAGGNKMYWTSPGVNGNCTGLPMNIAISVQTRPSV